MPIGISAQQLKQAGFDDETIIGYIEEQRPSLLGAGFSNNEIDKFYGITRQTPAPLTENDIIPIKDEGYSQGQTNGPTEDQTKTVQGDQKVIDVAKSPTNTSKPTPDYNSQFYKNVQARIEREKEIAAQIKANEEKGLIYYSDLTDEEKQQADMTMPITGEPMFPTIQREVNGKMVDLTVDRREKPTLKYSGASVVNTLVTTGPNSKIVLDRLKLTQKLEDDDIATLNEFMSFIGGMESDNRNIENFDATKGGVFQIPNSEMVTLLNQYANIAKAQNPEWKAPRWWDDAFVHKNAEKLPIDVQRALALVKLTTNADAQALLIKGAQGDKDALTTLYTDFYNPATEGRDLEKFQTQVNKYMDNWNTLNYQYTLPQVGTWDEDGWLTSWMKTSYGGRKFINMTGGAGDQNIFGNGYRLSTMGLIMAYHNAVTIDGKDPQQAYEEIFMHQTQNFAQDVVQSAVTLVNDLPAMGLGFVGGLGEGAVLTGLTGGYAAPATPFLAMGNAFGLPETIRDVYVRAMMNGEVNDFDQLLDEIMRIQTLKTYAKYNVVGMATYGAGSTVTKLGGGTYTRMGAEVATMVTLSSVLSGQVPTRKDFAHAAVLIFGIHHAAGGINKLYNIYKKYGVHPDDVRTLSERREDVKADLLDPEVAEPRALAELNEAFIEGLEASQNIKIVETPKFNQGDTVNISESGTVQGKVLAREENAAGEFILKVEKPSGEIVYIKEGEAHSTTPKDSETVTVDATGKIKIEQKVETNFEQRQQNGEFNGDILEIKIAENDITATRLLTESVNAAIKDTAKDQPVISGKNIIGTESFFVDVKAFPELGKQITNLLGKAVTKVKDSAEMLKNNFKNVKDDVGSRVQEVFIVEAKGPSKLDTQSFILRNKDGDMVAVPRALYLTLSRLYKRENGSNQVPDVVLSGDTLLILSKETEKAARIIAAIKGKKIEGQLKTQAESYYSNHIPKEEKVFADRARSSKGGDQWGVPDEPTVSGGGEAPPNMPRLESPWKALFNNNKGLDTFDLVEMVEVLIGKTPIVQRMPAGLRGYFSFREGLTPEQYKKALTVAVNKALAENPKDFTMTLAHEIGHLIDFLPESTMKKGNILGSMAALKGYMNKWVDGKADGAKPLSKAEIDALKAEAEAEAAKVEVKIDKEITEDLKITPEKILDIFRDPDIRSKIDPEFYEAFAKLSGKLKKVVTRSAMRGMIDPHIKALVDRINGKKPSSKADAKLSEEAAEIFKRKFETEIRERGLVSREEIHKELQALSQAWKPFDRAADPKYTAYRDNPRELMADFMMAFLLRPQWTALNAPKSYQLFQYHMYKRPEVKAQYMKLQNQLNAGADARYSAMVTRIADKFVDSNIRLYEQLEKTWKPNEKDAFHLDWLDTFGWFYRRFGGQNGMWGKNKSGNSRWMDKETLNLNARMESYRYRHAAITRYAQMMDNVVRGIEKLGYNHSYLSTMLLLRNLAMSQQRSGRANPMGLWAQIKEIGPEGEKIANEFVGDRTPLQAYEWFAKQHPEVDAAATKFYEIRKEFVLPLIRESKAFDKETLKKIENNEEYITFNVEKYALKRLEQSGGRNIVSASFGRKTEGTLSDITDPLMATLEKDMLLLGELKRNRMIHDAVQWMFKNKNWLEKFDEATMKEKTGGEWTDKIIARARYVGEGRLAPAPRGMETVGVMINGKYKFFYINKFAAEAFNRNPYHFFKGINYLSSSNNFFRTIFTEYNPLFWAKNMFRDVNRAVRNLPAARYVDPMKLGKNSYMKYLFKSLKPTWQMTFGLKEGTELTRMMEKEGFLISMMDGYHSKAGEKALKLAAERGEIPKDTYMLESMLQRMTAKEYESFYDKTMGRFFQHISDFAKFLERTHKVAGTMYLKDMVERGEISMSTQEMMLKVQADVGSPSFLRTARLHPIMNNLFIFSNAMKEGIRGDYVRLREDPLSVTSKYVAYNLAPKMIQKGAKYGLFGIGLATFYAGVSEYDEQNYIIIPLAYTKSGKPVYFRIPQDESARVMTGLVGLSMDAMFGKGEVGVQNFMKALESDLAPSLNPALPFIADSVKFMTGGNPIDTFRGEYALSEDVWKAQDIRTAKEALKYMWNSYGGSSIWRLRSDDPTEIVDELEQALRFPLAGSLANTFIKVGEHPVKMDIYKDFKLIDREKSRESLTFKEAMNKIISRSDEPLTKQELLVIAKRSDYIKNNSQLKEALALSTGGTDLLQMLISETDTKKKAIIMMKIQQFAQENPQDFPLLFQSE